MIKQKYKVKGKANDYITNDNKENNDKEYIIDDDKE